LLLAVIIIMSSGSLPFASYHRASQLGAGTFGSVVTVYNDDGQEFALKLFFEAEDDNNDSYHGETPMDVGVLREISILRLLRNDNKHENICELVDIQSKWGEEEGAGTCGCMSIALPLYKLGSMQHVIAQGTLKSYPRRVKVAIAHGLLSAVTYLHDNAIMHRDIKTDNVMLEAVDGDNVFKPVLIDFSLAKKLYGEDELDYCGHTGEIGTPTYTAPEIVELEPYGLPSDLWSVGVVLLELLMDEQLKVVKDRQAFTAIEVALEKMSMEQPFPCLLRGLLNKDQTERLTARGAIAHSLFQKFDMTVPGVHNIDIGKALPYEMHNEEENSSPNLVAERQNERSIEKRRKMVSRICRELNVANPATLHAALEYCQQYTQLDDSVDDEGSMTLLHCVLVAHRFFEVEMLDLNELEEHEKGTFADFTLDEFIEDEETIFMLMDYCLYPRFYHE
jgi:serine/threonine protein kinase